MISSCNKDEEKSLRYYEVGINGTPDNWRDSSFVVATADRQMIDKITEQLTNPVDRQIVMGDWHYAMVVIIKTQAIF